MNLLLGIMIDNENLNCFSSEVQVSEDPKKDVDDPPPDDMVSQSDSIAVVYGTAILENSSTEKIVKVTYESVFKVIDSKDHIKKNVLQVKVTEITTSGSAEEK